MRAKCPLLSEIRECYNRMGLFVLSPLYHLTTVNAPLPDQLLLTVSKEDSLFCT